MSGVEAVSFQELECGKKVAESKKRYKWKFSINGRSYNLELAVSTFSGKRIVTLNSVEIYAEQSILNYDFDYTHVIDGHVLRITRVPDHLNKFQMRIDNQNFQELKNNRYLADRTDKVNQPKKYQYDPFADFGNQVKPANPQSSNNDFGAFDFDSFSNPPTKLQQNAQTAKTAPSNNFGNFDFSAPNKVPCASNYQTVKFETNNFQTNATGNFFQNFSKFDKEVDEGDFATNTFNRNNLYNDLVFQKPQEKSDWNQFELKPEENESKFKIEMSAKQVMNKVKMTAESLKMKITGQDESLI